MGATRLQFALDQLTSQLPFQRGCWPPSSCLSYPIPCINGVHQTLVSWFSELKPQRTNLICRCSWRLSLLPVYLLGFTSLKLQGDSHHHFKGSNSKPRGRSFLAAKSPNELQCQTTPSGLWWLERLKSWWRGQGRDRKSVKSKQTKDKENTHTRCKVGAGLWVLIVGTDGEIERSDTHYTQDHVWERGKGREESAVGEAEPCKTGCIFLEKDLRKKRIGIYCWLEDQSSCHSLWLTNSALKNTLTLSLFRHLRIARPLYVAQSRKKSVKSTI